MSCNLLQLEQTDCFESKDNIPDAMVEVLQDKCSAGKEDRRGVIGREHFLNEGDL